MSREVRLSIRSLPRTNEAWKADAACRRVVDRYAQTWGWERAVNYVTSLYYAPGDGQKPGRVPAEPRLEEEENYFLPRLWCSTCPVAGPCLDEAVVLGDSEGFRAGLLPSQIRRVIQARRSGAGVADY